jgi:hypothetical protein
MPAILAESWPPLQTYCPILADVSVPQSLFLTLDCFEAFYGGAVGGGKTAALLMAALQYVDTPGYAALLLRRTFPELEQPDSLIPQSMRWFGTAPESVRPTYNRQDHEWTFPSGAVIRFGHLDNPNAMIRYQGGGYHFIGFDELTHFDETPYEFIALSRQRRPPSGPLSHVPMRVRATANPGGPGHMWVKRRFVDHRAEDVAFVPAKVWDNPGIDTDDYVSRLQKLSPTMVKQLLDGDWGAFEGAAFTLTDDHLLEPFDIPLEWDRFESMDYGLSNPTAWPVWAADYDENLVIFDCYYQPGLPSETAPMILKRRQSWRSTVCWGDPMSLATRTGTVRRFGDPATIETEFADHGVHVARANNNPRAGYLRLRELLKLDPERRFPDWHPRRGEYGAPRLFIVERTCSELVEQLRTAPLQPLERRFAGEMVDPDWEGRHGHAVAAARYGAMSRPGASEEPERVPDDPRLELLQRVERSRTESATRFEWRP